MEFFHFNPLSSRCYSHFFVYITFLPRTPFIFHLETNEFLLTLNGDQKGKISIRGGYFRCFLENRNSLRTVDGIAGYFEHAMPMETNFRGDLP